MTRPERPPAQLQPPSVLPEDAYEFGRALLASHPAHIAVLDANGVIIAVNPAWERFAAENGATDSHVGTRYVDVCGKATGPGGDEASAVAAGIRAVLDGTLPVFEIEYPCDLPTGARWFLLVAAPLRRRLGGAIVSHLDMTTRKTHEEHLRRRADELRDASARLKKINEELDQFAYITSHDLRAPLRGIANLSRWIEEDLGDAALTPETRRMLELMRGRVTRMEGLIDGILEYSRAGRVAAKTEDVDVAELVAETVDLLAPPPGARVEVQPGMPPVRAARLKLQQVFLNLIGNAFKHASRADPQVRVTWRDPGCDRLEFAVADNGPGIEPQYHDKIFVIFQTLAARDKVEGTGVGLALVKKIVESEGGVVRVESRPGSGATFTFTWPRKPAMISATTATATPTKTMTPTMKGP